MQRKKGSNAKTSKETVDRKESLRKKVKQKQDESLKSNLSDIIATSISLAGFVLASLTIIVTFKENITQKQNEAAINQADKPETNKNADISGIELLFTSVHYERIVGVFSWAAFILLFLFGFCKKISTVSFQILLFVAMPRFCNSFQIFPK